MGDCLILAILILLSISCSPLTVNTNPLSSGAKRAWNNEIFLAGAEIESVLMLGIQVSLPNLNISICSGYEADICVDKGLREMLKGGL